MDPQEVNTCRYHKSCWRRLRRLQRKVWKQKQMTKKTKERTGMRCGSSWSRLHHLTVASRSAFRTVQEPRAEPEPYPRPCSLKFSVSPTGGDHSKAFPSERQQCKKMLDSVSICVSSYPPFAPCFSLDA